MNERYDGQTYYDILEVPPSAEISEIYKAYQKAKVAYSPSSPALYTMFTPQEAQELLKLVEEAFQTLSHQDRRIQYDIKHGFQQAKVETRSMYSPTSTQANPQPAAKPPVKDKSSEWVGQVKITKRNDDLPAGFARTKLSTYEVKPEMEEQITNMSDCDGTFIQKIRTYRGVSIDRLAEEMRVTKSTLTAIESNNIDALPVAVFTRGHIVQIARFLNLDERRLADAYMKYFKARKLG